jgi:hypothetical protein
MVDGIHLQVTGETGRAWYNEHNITLYVESGKCNRAEGVVSLSELSIVQ